MESKNNSENSIKQLIKPSNPSVTSQEEIISLCEPNACAVNCTVGSILQSPDDDKDILL